MGDVVLVIGIDLGGTKCSVSYLDERKVVESLRLPTGELADTFPSLLAEFERLRKRRSVLIGVSCGGPLDNVKGVILNPPNLHESWHNVAICKLLTDAVGEEACLMNDANACALAEWKFGAGRGTQHMIFLTSGTGMGGGLVLNGALYEGATGDAGEIDHVRLSQYGPVGYGKIGSVEGFCSGGGIARLAEKRIKLYGGVPPVWAPVGKPLTLKQIAEAAHGGDKLAREIMAEAGSRLGEALAILIELFHPERIVLGGFFPLCRYLFQPTMNQSLDCDDLRFPARRAKSCQPNWAKRLEAMVPFRPLSTA